MKLAGSSSASDATTPAVRQHRLMNKVPHADTPCPNELSHGFTPNKPKRLLIGARHTDSLVRGVVDDSRRHPYRRGPRQLPAEHMHSDIVNIDGASRLIQLPPKPSRELKQEKWKAPHCFARRMDRRTFHSAERQHSARALVALPFGTPRACNVYEEQHAAHQTSENQ